MYIYKKKDLKTIAQWEEQQNKRRDKRVTNVTPNRNTRVLRIARGRLWSHL